MRLATTLTHNRLRLKHGFLKLRVHQPAYYQFLVAAMLVAAVGGLVAAFYFFVYDGNKSSDLPELVIKTYSINGQVTKMEGNQLYVKATVVKVEQGIGQVSYEIKTVTVTDQTPVKIKNMATGREIDGKISDILPGSNVVIYSSSSTSTSILNMVDNIEILTP